MVLLCMTQTVVAAVQAFNKLKDASLASTEPSLENPAQGNPVSHSQLIQISRSLRDEWRASRDAPAERFQFSLELLLRGCDVYKPPKPAKAEPTNEYKALMARLRREQEEREYEGMTGSRAQTADVQAGIRSRMPMRDMMTMNSSNNNDEEMTFADVNRQLTLIINVVVTVLACGIGIWLVASRWSAASRLAVSMAGSGLIGTAEVVIYAGYIRRLHEAKTTERKVVERKTIESSWVIHARESLGRASERIPAGRAATGAQVVPTAARRRQK